jgi:DNA-binding transcriptional ArsR family regulator
MTVREDEVGGRTGRSCGDAAAPCDLLDDVAAERLAEIFKVLSDPTRVRIVAALAQEAHCVHELADRLGMSQSAISHQLATLRAMRVVAFTREGRHVYYTLDDDHVHDLFRVGLEHILHT